MRLFSNNGDVWHISGKEYEKSIASLCGETSYTKGTLVDPFTDLDVAVWNSPYGIDLCPKCATKLDMKDYALLERGVKPLNKYIHDVNNSEEVSDGYHTFGSLYEQRTMLFAVIVNQNVEHAFKALKHEDGTMFRDYFIVGVETPEGPFTYHCEKKYWNLFKCQQYARAPKWDGHTEKDITRLFSLDSWYNVTKV